MGSETPDKAAESMSDHWKLDNATGVLREVLLGKPDHFEWRPISPIARRRLRDLDKLGIRFNRQAALEQHQEMVSVYESAGVRCHFLAANEGLPCSVYARDSSAMTAWGPIVMSIQTPWRRRDYAVVSEFYRQAGQPIWRWVTAGHFEGGDFAVIEPGAVMLGHGGERSEASGAQQVSGWLEAEGWETMVVPISSHFVHMDALVVMLAPKLAVACLEALEDYVVDWLESRKIEIVPVSYRSCVRLGCNVVTLGNDRVLSMASNQELNEQLQARGFEVFAPDMSMYQHGGGGVHCLCQELRRDPA